MNLGNKIWMSLVLLVSVAQAADSFSVRGMVATPGPDGETPDTVSILKRQAVIQWIEQKYGAAQAAQLAPLVGSEMADSFILDYQVTPAGQEVILTGSRDTVAITKWIQLQQIALNQSVKPAVIFTAASPQLAVPTVNQYLTKSLKTTWARLKASATFPTGLSRTTPPQTADEMASLRREIPEPMNLALWLHWVPCEGCRGVRVDSYLYQLNPGRLLMVRSDELKMDAGQMHKEPLFKPVVDPFVDQLGRQLEDVVSRGLTQASPYTVRIENISSPKLFHMLWRGLAKLESVAEVRPARVQSMVAEFSLQSTATAAQLSQWIAQADWGGARLASSFSSGSTLTFRVQ